MSIIDDYFDSKERILSYFKYSQGCRELPFEDGRNYHWMIIDYNLIYSDVIFIAEDLGVNGGNFYQADIYSHDPCVDYVHFVDNYAMIPIDTRVDGNKFLMILTASLECKDEELKNIYRKNW